METKRVELGDVFYVFCNWGLCRGRVRKIITNEFGTQYKLNVDYDKNNLDKKYGYFFSENQLFKDPFEALTSLSFLDGKYTLVENETYLIK